MTNIYKIFNFEKRKLFSNKSLIILFSSVFIITIMIIMMSFLAFETNIVNEVTHLQKEQILLSYNEEIIELNELLNSPFIDDAEKNIYLDKIIKLEFYISNNIVEYECIEYESNTLFKYSNNLCVSFMFYFLISIYYFSFL